jgi:glycosyltransferase involved in cell wall biosynthesis
LKILMIAPQPFLEPRGTPISVFQRLSGLSQLGHSIDLLTYHIGEDVEMPGVRIIRTAPIPMVKQLKVGPSWAKIPLDLVLFFKAVELLVKNKYDVIHSHEEAAVFAVFLASLFRTPHLYDMHSSLPKQLANFNFGNYRPIIKLFEFFERLAIRNSQAVITIGTDLEKKARAIDPEINQVMIENLPLRSAQADERGDSSQALRAEIGIGGKKAIVYTGTFERYQGVELLVESIATVVERHPDLVLVLVGGKPEQIQSVQELAVEKHVDDYVLFTGTVPVEKANQYLNMADILVSPRIEGTSVPLKIYTYLHQGKPILATNLTAHTLVLDDETAVLVEPTAEALASGLLQLLENGRLRDRLGENSHKLAKEKYDTASYLEKLEYIYRTFEPRLLVEEPVNPPAKELEGN